MGKKKKFFVFSDVHSFYDKFIKALKESGYKEDNPNHYLIGLGDSFDRGDQSQEMLDFLNSHRDRVTLINGNHDRPLMTELLQRKYYMTHDMSNGTVKTVLDLAGMDYEECYFGIRGITEKGFQRACDIAREKLTPVHVRMLDYFETKNYIFVHSWIPFDYAEDENLKDLPYYYRLTDKVYMPEWREAVESQWDEAVWVNPFKMNELGLNQTGKTIVCGHYHTSWAHAIDRCKKDTEFTDFDELEWGSLADFSIYKGEGIIGIDACTAYSGKVNILVLEDELLDE